MSDKPTIISRLDEPIARLQAAIDGLAAAITGEKTGVAALQGKLPAEESDAEFLAQVAAENAKKKPAPAVLMIPDMAKKATAEFCGANPGRIYSIDVEKISAVVARRAVAELVRRAEAVAATHKPQYKPFVSPDELRSIAAEMKGEA